MRTIVQRLRLLALWEKPGGSSGNLPTMPRPHVLCEQAADEIERLTGIVEETAAIEIRKDAEIDSLRTRIEALEGDKAELLEVLNALLDAPETAEWGETRHSRDQRAKARADAEAVIARLKQ